MVVIPINNKYIDLDRIDELWSNIGNRITANQTILKLLYYNDEDALTKPNLNINQIKDIVGKNDEKDKRLFKTPFNGDISDQLKSELRFYATLIEPQHAYLGKAIFNFEIIVHNSLWELSDNKLRPIRLVQELLKDFNGTNISGIGRLKLRGSIGNLVFGKNFSGYKISFDVGVV